MILPIGPGESLLERLGTGRGILYPKSPGSLAEGGRVGGGRRRVTRADLEAMLGEFEIVEHYGGP